MSALDAGYAKFIANCPPLLDDGEYKIEVSQNVSQATTPIPQDVREFLVKGPRFAITMNDVHAVYPPANHEGLYDESLSHIVLNRRTLPWERTIDGSIAKRVNNATDCLSLIPWLTLFSFSEEEGVAVKQVTLQQLLQPQEKDVLAPDIFLDEAAGETLTDKCLVVDVPKELFLKIMPTHSELPFLSHVRSVSMENKDTTLNNKDGWFSVVVGNRFPVSSNSGVKNSVHLISLEGWGSYVPGGPQSKDIPADKNFLRFVSLTSWEFTGIKEKYHFKEIVTALSTGQPLSIPVEDSEGTEAANTLNMGYTASNHSIRDGEKTVSWYRGALVPLTLKDNGMVTYSCADAALRYDPDIGMLDVSYAAAWQLGRLLALHDRSFAISLLQWRRQNRRDLMHLIYQQILQQNFGDVLTYGDGNDSVIKIESMNNVLLNFWQQGPITKRIQTNKKSDQLEELADPSQLKKEKRELPGFLNSQQVNTILAAKTNIIETIHKELF